MSDNIRELTNTIIRCGNLLVHEASRLLKVHDITPVQFNVLRLLHAQPRGLRPSDIAHSLVVEPASITYLLDQLVKRDWCTRDDDPADRRAYRIVLTAVGRAKHQQVNPDYTQALALIEQWLKSTPTSGQIITLLRQLSDLAAEATDAVIESQRATSAPRRTKPARASHKRV